MSKGNGVEKKLVVYTGIFGKRDLLKDPVSLREDAQYVCFTDDPSLRSDVWDVRFVEQGKIRDEPALLTKQHKMFPHTLFPNCEISLWIDASYRIHDLRYVFSLFDSTGAVPYDMAVMKHPTRSCVYTEASRALRTKADKEERLYSSVNRLKSLNYPKGNGLYRGGFLLRRNIKSVNQFNEAWYSEVFHYSRRDQLSLPLMLQEYKIRFMLIPPGAFDLRWHRHLTGARR